MATSPRSCRRCSRRQARSLATSSVGGIDLSPATVDGIIKGYISASFDQVLYLQGYFPVQQIFLTKNYLIPGLHIDTGVGTVTPQNYQDLKPLIDQGIR